METAIIKNDYDGPKKQPRTLKGRQIPLDFVYSVNATEVDAGIRETIRGVKLSIMAMGIALYRVDVSCLFIDLGFKKFGEYIDHLAEDTGMARTSLYNWEYIGEAYITHRADLEKIGFSDYDGPTKLPFLLLADAFSKGLIVMTFSPFSQCCRTFFFCRASLWLGSFQSDVAFPSAASAETTWQG